MSHQSYLIDTNILIGLEDNLAVQPVYSKLLNLAAKHGVSVFVHEAARDDITRDKDEERRKISLSKIEKYRLLKKRQGLTKEKLESTFGSLSKRNPNCFEENIPALKPGTRLVRNWNGTRHSVLVQAAGYEYKGKVYGSLSQIASEITGTRWNGWIFFGLKKKEGAA